MLMRAFRYSLTLLSWWRLEYIKLPNFLNCHTQVRADHIQSDLDELVKTLNEHCKKYGLYVKPTTLVELPFGNFISCWPALFSVLAV